MGNVKWKVISALGATYISFWLNLPWLFGIVLLAWVIPDLRNGQTHFFEPLSRHKDPVLYWLVIATWGLFGIYLLIPSRILLQ